jgi:uncharacterized membrane protein HdeD (DUF308 family)
VNSDMNEVKGDPEEVTMVGREVQMSGWSRALALTVGIISIILAFIVIVNPFITVATLALIFSIALFILGVDRLATGIVGKRYETVAVKRGRPAQM